MIINLTDKDGLLLAQWDVEEEFGDIEQQLPRSEMTLAILDEYRLSRGSGLEAVTCANCGREKSYTYGVGCPGCNWLDDDEQRKLRP